MTAPEAPGDYVLRHRLVKENTAWFADVSGVSVVVSEGSDPTWLFVGVAGIVTVSGAAGLGLLYLLHGQRPFAEEPPGASW